MTQFFSPSVPASHPVLTLSRSRAQTLEGDEVSLRCEARRGSLPICFQFYHESMLLKKAEGTIWRSVSFRFTVTAEHSGHYYCTADNGLGPQYSEAASLSVTGKTYVLRSVTHPWPLSVTPPEMCPHLLLPLANTVSLTP